MFCFIGYILFFRTVVLRLIGKTSIQETKNSALMRVYLENGDHVFRLAIWRDHIGNALDYLQIGNVSFLKCKCIHLIFQVLKLKKVKIAQFFKDDAHPDDKSVWDKGEFVMTELSSIEIVERGAFIPYPPENKFPPFWKTLDKVKIGERDVGKIFIFLAIIYFIYFIFFSFDCFNFEKARCVES